MKFSAQVTIVLSVEVEAISMASARDAAARFAEAIAPTEDFVTAYSEEAYRGTSTKLSPFVGFDIEGAIDVEEEQEDAQCRIERCGGDPNNGDGWDGYCGNCADQLDNTD